MTQDPRNWTALGLEWETDAVQSQHGDHATDRVVVNSKAQLPKIVGTAEGFAAFREHFGDDVVLAWLNSSNSLRVRAQHIARTKKFATVEANREAVYLAIRGARMVATSRPSIDWTAKTADLAADFVDRGLDATTAMDLAKAAVAIMQQAAK